MLFPMTGLLGFVSGGGGGGGGLSCWLPASTAMSGLTLSMLLGYPSSIPGSGDGGKKGLFCTHRAIFSEKKKMTICCLC